MTVPLVALIPIVAFAGTGDVVGDPAVEPVAQQGPQTAIAALVAADLGRSSALARLAPQPVTKAAPRKVAPAPQRLSSPRAMGDTGLFLLGAGEDELLLTADQEAPPAPGAMPPAAPDADAETIDADEALIDDRRRPGLEKKLPDRVTQDNPGAVRAPAPEAFPTDEFPVPDRWRIVTSLCPTKGGDQSIYGLYPNLSNVCRSKLDPYHQNVLKGDRPLPEGKRPSFLKEDDWFFIANVVSDTVIEPRSFPTPVGVQTTARPDSLDVFGRADSLVVAQTVIAGFSLLKGETA